MEFRVIGRISHVEVIAVGRSIRVVPHLRRAYGPGRWRKMKGIARIELSDGTIRDAELHWYEAHGIGRVELKVKKYVD